MPEERRAPSAPQEKPLRESLEDASVLLWYATREGKQVSKETITDIVNAQSTLKPGIRDAEVEGSFWAALRELAAAVKPASIDSILATYSYPFGHHGESGKRRLVDAKSTKRRYSSAAIGVLICLLSLQIYWFIGTTIRTHLQTHRDELDNISGSLRAMSLDIRNFDRIVKSKNNDIYSAIISIKEEQINTANTRNHQGDIAELTAALEIIKTGQDETWTGYVNAIKRSYRINKTLRGDVKMINWIIPSPTDNVEAKSENIETKPENIETKPENIETKPSEYCNDLQTIYNNTETNLVAIDRELFENADRVELSLLNSQATLAIFTQYFLPLLYGLLGSLAYILRTLSSEIQNVTFTRGSEIRYSLRWPLGMLAGVTVGLFFDPTHFSGLAVITPLGLAFLAGYGVELLFTGLDRMVSAFTSEGAERPKAP